MDPDPAGMNVGSFIALLLLFILQILFSIVAEAFAAVGEGHLHELEEQGDRRAAKIRHMTDNERRFSERIRLAEWLNTGIAAAIAVWQFGGALQSALRSAVAAVLIPAVIVILLFTIFGSRLPRRLVARNPENNALKTVGLIRPFYFLLYPPDMLAHAIVYPVLRLCGVHPHEETDAVTEEDILEMMDAGEETGAIEGTQKDMVNNVFAFDDITAAEIMTPRTDVVAAEIGDPVDEVLRAGVENGYSRIPVYEEDIDHIVGILSVKDLLPYVGQAIPDSVSVRSLLRETHFVPDTKKCDDLFEEMSEKHLQMAIVVDEYGGVAGIVTMEDLLESIVGNMQDEFDNEDEEITRLDEHSFEIDGSLNIGELGELLGVEFPEGDYDTVGGFLMDQLGHIPEKDENATVTYKNVTLTIREMDDRRIETVHAEITDDPDLPADGKEPEEKEE